MLMFRCRPYDEREFEFRTSISNYFTGSRYSKGPTARGYGGNPISARGAATNRAKAVLRQVVATGLWPVHRFRFARWDGPQSLGYKQQSIGQTRLQRIGCA